ISDQLTDEAIGVVDRAKTLDQPFMLYLAYNAPHLPNDNPAPERYTQRIERHNLNLRQHLARLGRKSLSFSKSVELHDKVIGHYLNIKHYQ
ncbi:IS1 family transposase, partial [Escherichia coli]